MGAKINMSGFGMLMIIVTIIWSFISLSWVVTSETIYDFFNYHFVVVFIGYLAIIVMFIVLKKIATAGTRR